MPHFEDYALRAYRGKGDLTAPGAKMDDPDIPLAGEFGLRSNLFASREHLLHAWVSPSGTNGVLSRSRRLRLSRDACLHHHRRNLGPQ